MRKNKLLLLLVLLMAVSGAWAQDYYAPSTDEVIILNDVYDDSKSGYSSHSAIAWGGSALTYEKKAGDPNNGGKSTEERVNCFSVKGNGEGKSITLSITGVSKVFVYHERNTRYIELRDGSKVGNIIGSGQMNTYYTEVALTATNKYSIFLHGTRDGSDDQDVYVYAIKLIAAPAATYSVTLAEGTEDSDKWTISPTEAAEGSPVIVTYSGEKKVKSVKAVKKGAAPAPSVPDGAINGKFSVSATKKVYFSKGNLRYASDTWSFFDNQYDYYTSYSADAQDHFGWSTSATTYGMNTSTNSSDYSGDFVDWGATMGTGWRTLTSDEWEYLFNTRTVNNGTGGGKSYTLGKSVGGVLGVVLYPDDYTGAEYSGSDWASFESAGCVFLPAAGRRKSRTVTNAGSYGYYWSSSPDTEDADYVSNVYFDSDNLNPANNDRYRGFSVRLVQEVAAQ